MSVTTRVGWVLATVIALVVTMLAIPAQAATPVKTAPSARKASAASPLLSAGGRDSCVIRADQTLWCWGANGYGQLGVGDRAYRLAPVQVGVDATWQRVSTGALHTCGVRIDGTLWCWGLNNRGQLGLRTRTDALEPRQVGSRTDWSTVTAGGAHTCATRTDGSAWCWGDNSFGQLGIGSRAMRKRPVRVDATQGWTNLRAGGWVTCGVDVSGGAFCWGRNGDGELGIGVVGYRTRPQPVGTNHDWVEVIPSWNSTCGLRASGAVQCWGANNGRQLGSGSAASSLSPVDVAGGHVFTSLAVGVSHACAADAAGSVWCWGRARYGQFGGVKVARTPVQVPGVGGVAALASGWLHLCATTTTGDVACWGNNEVGAVGNGSGVNTSTAVSLAFAPTTPPMRARRLEPIAPASTAAEPRARKHAANRKKKSGPAFTLVSFNALGSNHTAPRSDAADFTNARVRAEWTLDNLRRLRASIFGFQELQRDQFTWLESGSGKRYAFWPGTSGKAGVQTTIGWRRNQWTLLKTRQVKIPFIKQHRYMPLVRLQHRATGAKVWVMNVHNAPQGRQKQRNVAIRREIKLLRKIKHGPILVIGDFNERRTAFCKMTGRVPMIAAKGGERTARRCTPPAGRLRVDWIFGSKDVAFSKYLEDRSTLTQRITDHAVLRARVKLP